MKLTLLLPTLAFIRHGDAFQSATSPMIAQRYVLPSSSSFEAIADNNEDVAAKNINVNSEGLGRRDAISTLSAGASVLLFPGSAAAAAAPGSEFSLFYFEKPPASKSDAFAFSKGSSASLLKKGSTITPLDDAPPKLALRTKYYQIKMPRVAYSMYNTKREQAASVVNLALRAGVKHFDLATDYDGSSSTVAPALRQYFDVGKSALTFAGEDRAEPSVRYMLERLDVARRDGELRDDKERVDPEGSIGRKGRRERLFLTHKLSNSEQSTDPTAVRRAVKGHIADLGSSYLDMVSIHSPLTNKETRLSTYETLLGMRDSGFVKSVGVCNYGVAALKEIQDAGLELPSINQLELSPFNAHSDVVDFCGRNNIAVSCAAWSKLNSDGPSKEFTALADLAKAKDATEAQVLVRWALQKGYACAPTAGSDSSFKPTAIAENSYGGVNSADKKIMLSAEEMKILDGLDVGYKAGKLGRKDGWTDSDVAGPEWDPTEAVV